MFFFRSSPIVDFRIDMDHPSLSSRDTTTMSSLVSHTLPLFSRTSTAVLDTSVRQGSDNFSTIDICERRRRRSIMGDHQGENRTESQTLCLEKKQEGSLISRPSLSSVIPNGGLGPRGEPTGNEGFISKWSSIVNIAF